MTEQPRGNGPRELRCICSHDMATHIIDQAHHDSICAAAGCPCKSAHLWCITFQAPDGRQYKVHDVAKFVRKDFPQLFTRPETAIRTKPHDDSDYTIAEDGLRHLAAGYAETWHDWLIVTKPKTFKA